MVSFYMILYIIYFFELQKFNITAEIETLDKKLWFEILGVVQNSNWKQAWMFAELRHIAISRGCKHMYSSMWWDLLQCALREKHEDSETMREFDVITMSQHFKVTIILQEK